MAEDILTYTFDFEREVNALRADLGEWADNILFINIRVTKPDEANGSPEVSLQQVIGKQPLIDKDLPHIRGFIEAKYKKTPSGSSYADYIVRNGTHSADYIAVRENSPFSYGFDEENKHWMQLFEFYHETFHALANDDDNPDEDHPLKECSADAYAALCLFQRFGADARDLLSMVSWSRAFGAVMGDTKHLTTTVLDKIIADSASQGFFAALTAEETIELAEHYAAEWTPEASVLSAARASFRQAGPDIDAAHAFKKGILSPVNPLDLYISAKVLQLFLAPQEIRWNGESIVGWDEESKSVVTEAIKERMVNWSLSETFNKKAAVKTGAGPAITTALPVAPPKGQKIFTVKTDFS